MSFSISITVRPEDEKNESALCKAILSALFKKNIRANRVFLRETQEIQNSDALALFEKKSIDARRSEVKIVMRYKIYIGEKPNGDAETLPVWKNASGEKKVAIVGSGPAGLFAAFRLLEDGIKPIIVERGGNAGERTSSIQKLRSDGILDAESNYCFGEGGAGTFSDGKLYTRSNKRGDIAKIYRIFVEFGANQNILTDAHPHIGTDKLPSIICAMRKKIISLGGEFHFLTKCVDFLFDGDCADEKKIRGIVAEKDGNRFEIAADAVILASGHSAADIYSLVAKYSPESLEAKTFAAGVRVEHPRSIIDSIQFHGKKMQTAAEYRLATQADGRGVYSFCMCPGGFVVPCATAQNQIVVNGMSASGRNSKWSNAAIVVEIRPEDIPSEFVQAAKEKNCAALAGLLWRTWLEEQTFSHARGQNAPAQRLSDFLKKRESKNLPESSYLPGIVPSRLDEWLPKHICGRLQTAFLDFNRSMRGFVCDSAVLIASETRTSTPVRILRDKDSLECVGIKNLYPAGEGSGYSGGIGSSAMDGEKAAAAICKTLLR